MKLNVGDRVYCGMPDREGNPLNGTIIKSGIFIIVRCDTLVDKRYCHTDELEVMFVREQLTLI